MESLPFITSAFIFPPVSYFSSIRNSTHIIIDLSENYQKRSHRNRYDILTSNGKQSLSIPLKKGKNEKQAISEVLISYDEIWVKQHLQAIQSAYGKSPYFEHYFPIISTLLQRRYEKLYELNDAVLKQLLKSLKWQPLISASERYMPEKSELIYVEKRYTQVFEYKYGFVQNLSIIDLLFNTGPEAVYYL